MNRYEISAYCYRCGSAEGEGAVEVDCYIDDYGSWVKYEDIIWVSVKDRLPEIDGRYVVYTKDGSLEIYSYHTGDYVNCGWIKNASVQNNVTHWMPLPEPPK